MIIISSATPFSYITLEYIPCPPTHAFNVRISGKNNHSLKEISQLWYFPTGFPLKRRYNKTRFLISASAIIVKAKPQLQQAVRFTSFNTIMSGKYPVFLLEPLQIQRHIFNFEVITSRIMSAVQSSLYLKSKQMHPLTVGVFSTGSRCFSFFIPFEGLNRIRIGYKYFRQIFCLFPVLRPHSFVHKHRAVEKERPIIAFFGFEGEG